MKNVKTCIKCHADGVIRVPGDVRVAGAGNNIVLGATIFSAVKVSRYICASCGYSEEWIDDAADLEKIKKKYGAA